MLRLIVRYDVFTLVKLVTFNSDDGLIMCLRNMVITSHTEISIIAWKTEMWKKFGLTNF
jgi:hypothetical protein